MMPSADCGDDLPMKVATFFIGRSVLGNVVLPGEDVKIVDYLLSDGP